MKDYGFYVIWGIGAIVFTAAMAWAYVATDATAFLGMMAFGLVWLVFPIVAALDESRHPGARGLS